jgi:DNA-binding transcriptional MerR regulator
VATGEVPTQLTISDVAARAGMTVRNIRAYQSKGLLPPPDVRGRVAYYGDRHVARLHLIRTLQRVGFNLAAIRRLVDGGPGHASLLAELRARVADDSDGSWQELTVAGAAFLRSLGPDFFDRLQAGGLVRTRADVQLVHPAIVGSVAALRDGGLDAARLAELQVAVIEAAEPVIARVRSRLDGAVNAELGPLLVQLLSATWEIALQHRLAVSQPTGDQPTGDQPTGRSPTRSSPAR